MNKAISNTSQGCVLRNDGKNRAMNVMFESIKQGLIEAIRFAQGERSQAVEHKFASPIQQDQTLSD